MHHVDSVTFGAGITSEQLQWELASLDIPLYDGTYLTREDARDALTDILYRGADNTQLELALLAVYCDLPRARKGQRYYLAVGKDDPSSRAYLIVSCH